MALGFLVCRLPYAQKSNNPNLSCVGSQCTQLLLAGAARDIFFFIWLTKAESVAIVDISGASRFMTNRELALGKIMRCMCLPILVPCLARPQHDAAYVCDRHHASHPSAHQELLSSPNLVLGMLEITVPICVRVHRNFTKLILTDESVDLL